MKAPLLVFAIFLFACESNRVNTSLKESVDTAKTKNISVSEVEQVREKYPIGDVDKDMIQDTATVIFNRDYTTDEIVCDQKDCPIVITFGRKIPALTIDQSLGVVVRKAEDINKDKANELLIFSRTYRGWWNEISVWSFKNQKWIKVAKTEAFISEDKDFENRIIQENGSYYLLGDGWDNDKGVTERTEKVKL